MANVAYDDGGDLIAIPYGPPAPGEVVVPGMRVIAQGSGDPSLARSDVYFPTGASVDIYIEISWLTWFFDPGIYRNFVDGLAAHGLRVDSQDISRIGNQATFHCTATQDVYLSSLDTKGNHVLDEGGNVVTADVGLGWIILGLLVLAGVAVYSISKWRISANQTNAVKTAAVVAEKAIAAGYSGGDVASIVEAVEGAGAAASGGGGGGGGSSWTDILKGLQGVGVIIIIGIIVYAVSKVVPSRKTEAAT